MVDHPPIDLVLPGALWERLRAHLFQGGGEHGAVIAAGVAHGDRSCRLLARDLFLAREGVDYVVGQRGHRMLTADFVRDRAIHCRDEGLAYLAVHNHFGRDSVAFSSVDLESHERGYPALRDILGGPPVGGLVFAENAVAGDVWFPKVRRTLRSAVILEASTRRLFPDRVAEAACSEPMYDRQARLFGDAGQLLIGRQRVGIVGLGGVGSIVAEILARLGIGELVLVDPERLELSNIPRVLNCSVQDTGTAKVQLAKRAALAANPDVTVIAMEQSVIDEDVARQLVMCDALVLAADTMQARLVFNAITHQYLIPGFQIGSKVTVNEATGFVDAAFSVVRRVDPTRGCLICNGLISAERLAEEALTPAERRAQRYVDGEELVAPSVITLNAVGASLACNELMMRTVGLRNEQDAQEWTYVDALSGRTRLETPRKDVDCLECGLSSRSRFARGDGVPLPTRQRPS